MLSYIHFTHDERICLQKLLSENKSFREIAALLGRSPSTISREVKRNRAKYPPKHKSDNKYNYHHWRAQVQTICRRRQIRRTALKSNSFKYNYVVDKLTQFWSPEQISMRMRIDFPNEIVGVSTIYRYIKRGDLPNISKKTHLRRKGKNRNYVHHNCNVIHPDHIIPKWTDAIKNRSRVGDWEGDTVYGGIGKGLIVTLVDRKSGFLRAGILKRRNAEETRLLIQELLNNHTEENLIILQELNGVIRQDGKSSEKFIWETSRMIEDKLTEFHRLKAELRNQMMKIVSLTGLTSVSLSLAVYTLLHHLRNL